MNDSLFMTLVVLACLFIGLLVGVVLQADADADKLSFLTNKTQAQFWEMQGLEQKVKQYESNPCSDVIIQTQFIEKVNK